MPGQEKMVSVTIAPASKAPNCNPSTVSIGNHGVAEGVPVDYSPRGLRPLARAVRM